MKLSRVQALKEQIEEVKVNLEVLRGRFERVSPILDMLPKMNSPLTSRVEELAAQIVDSERELEKLRGEHVEVTATLPKEIKERVKGHSAQVLILRYCTGKTFKEIAREMCFSETTIYGLHRQGVQQFNSAK